MRVLAGNYQYASSNVVTRGAYAAAPAGIKARLTGSYFTAANQTFKLIVVSPGNYVNTSLTSIASNNGIGNPNDDTTGGVLNIGTREKFKMGSKGC